jgi:cyclopropane-fatty-acyl-phospholipid synthase
MRGAMSPIKERVETEVAPRTPPIADRQARRPRIVDEQPGRPQAAPFLPNGEARRRAMAHAIVEIVDRAIADRDALEIVPAGQGRARSRGARSRVVVNTPDALPHVLLPPSGDAFAEAYLRGEIEIEGDVMATVLAAETLDVRRLRPADLRRIVRWLAELRRDAAPVRSLQRSSRMRGALHSRARDMAAIRFHYDVGEAFYSLWLDARLTYSCAYFPAGATALTAAGLLDVAQDAKLDLIARKLRLGPGTRLLDIGCGWGSLIDFAAERYGTPAVGVTLSQRQADEANARAARAGVGPLVDARVLDYRDLESLGRFDAVASVGMFEHVGRANLPTYFKAAFDALEPGGLFLNHGIAGAGSRRRPSRLRPRGNRFLQRYVFPDGELVAVEDAVAYARAAGFEVLDVQSLRPHYALTLAAWVARLEANWPAAVKAAGDEVARTWRLYMSAARLGFERGELDVCQLLLAKPANGRPAEVPIRPWW